MVCIFLAWLNIFPYSQVIRIFFCIFSKCFKVLLFLFWFLIHLKLIFMYGMEQKSVFTFFFSLICNTRSIMYHCIKCGSVPGFSFCSVGLFFILMLITHNLITYVISGRTLSLVSAFGHWLFFIHFRMFAKFYEMSYWYFY